MFWITYYLQYLFQCLKQIRDSRAKKKKTLLSPCVSFFSEGCDRTLWKSDKGNLRRKGLFILMIAHVHSLSWCSREASMTEAWNSMPDCVHNLRVGKDECMLLLISLSPSTQSWILGKDNALHSPSCPLILTNVVRIVPQGVLMGLYSMWLSIISAWQC